MSDYFLLRSDLRRVRRAHYAAGHYLDTFDLSALTRVHASLGADQAGGEMLLVFNTGAAHSITPILDDFVTELKPVDSVAITTYADEPGITPHGVGS